MNILASTDSIRPDQPGPIDPKIYQSVGNDSIKALTEKLSWDDAKKKCELEKANLASLRNEWTSAYVELLANLQGPLWIGLNKNKVKNSRHQKLLHHS